MTGLGPNPRRVQDALSAAGSAAKVRQLDTSTHTAQQAADALGVRVEQIAKTLVFLADDRPVVVVIGGADRVDVDIVGSLLGARSVKSPAPREVLSLTGYPAGGVSPVALPEGTPVFVDRGLARRGVVWVAAGTPNAVFPSTFAELVEVCRAVPADLRQAQASSPR